MKCFVESTLSLEQCCPIETARTVCNLKFSTFKKYNETSEIYFI